MTRRRNARATYATQLLELGIAAPQVVAHRLARMAQAGATPSARDRREFTGMVMEKQVAFASAWMAMWAETAAAQQQLALSWLSGASPAAHLAATGAALDRIAARGLAPVRRKAMANARRLARTRR